ncbi:hypothetical protein Hanom_Chr03g00239051 [Helianthus anomalus]
MQNKWHYINFTYTLHILCNLELQIEMMTQKKGKGEPRSVFVSSCLLLANRWAFVLDVDGPGLCTP